MKPTVYLWLTFYEGTWHLNCSTQGFRLAGDGFGLGQACSDRAICEVMLANAVAFFEKLGCDVVTKIEEPSATPPPLRGGEIRPHGQGAQGDRGGSI